MAEEFSLPSELSVSVNQGYFITNSANKHGRFSGSG